jgi:DNA polymerase I - 3''-5'' exonuclease and polymerase domains
VIAEEIELWKLWSQLLQSHKVKKVGQNASFEYIKSWLYGIYPTEFALDTLYMHHCLYPDFGGITDEWSGRKRDIDNPGHGLAFITSQYTDQHYYKDDGRNWTPALGEEKFWQYNCLDVMVTFEAAMKMKLELEKTGLWKTYVEMYQEELEHNLRMEWNGVALDVERRQAAGVTMLAEIAEISQAIKAEVGYDRVVAKRDWKTAKAPVGVLNLSSPKQMQYFLYEQRRHKPVYKVDKRTKQRKITTDKDALNSLARKDPVIYKIIKMKQIQDLKNDIIDQPLDAEGRMHFHVKTGGTNGTRKSTAESILGSGFNAQNLPRQGIARSLFLPS